MRPLSNTELIKLVAARRMKGACFLIGPNYSHEQYEADYAAIRNEASIALSVSREFFFQRFTEYLQDVK